MTRKSDVEKLREAFRTVSPSGLQVFRIRGDRSYDDLKVGVIINGQRCHWVPSGQVLYGPQRATNGKGEFVYLAALFPLYGLNGRVYAVANMLTGGRVAAYEVAGPQEGYFVRSAGWERKNEILAED